MPGLVSHPGFACKGCDFVTRSTKLKQRHQNQGKCAGAIERVPCTQSFYGNQGSANDAQSAQGPHAYVFVTRLRGASQPALVQQGEEALRVAFTRSLQSAQVISGATCHPARIGLYRLHWADRVASIPALDMYDLTRIPPAYDSDPDAEQTAPEHWAICKVYLVTITLFKAANRSLRESTSHIRTRVFSDNYKTLTVKEKKSCARYARLLARFVCFAVRAYVEPPSSFTGLPAFHHTASAVLRRIVAFRATDGENGNQEEDPDFQALIKQLIHILLFEPSVRAGAQPERFLLAWWLPMHFKVHGSFAVAPTMAADMAHLDFGCRLMLLRYYDDLAADLGDNDLEGLDRLCAKCDTDLRLACNSYSYLVHCREVMSAEAKSSTLMSNLSWEDTKGLKLRVGRSLFTVQSLTVTAQYLIDRCWTQFVHDLSLGHVWDRLKYSHSIQDDYTNRRVGYNFTCEPLNQFGSNTTSLLELIYNTDELRKEFKFRCEADGRFTASPIRVQKYLVAANEFRLNLLAAIHLTYGGPARTTELAETLLVNCDTQLRDVIITSGRIGLANAYNKTNAITGTTNQIIRILAPCLSELVIQYLVYVRPFELTMDYIMYPSDTGERLLSTHLVVHERKRVTSHVLSRHLGNTFAIFGVHGVCVSNYRHAFSAFARRHGLARNREEEAVFDDMDDVVEEQSGHSAATGRIHYARSTGDWSGMDPNRILVQNAVTDRWTSLIGVLNYQPKYVDARPVPPPPVTVDSAIFTPDVRLQVTLTPALSTPPRCQRAVSPAPPPPGPAPEASRPEPNQPGRVRKASGPVPEPSAKKRHRSSVGGEPNQPCPVLKASGPIPEPSAKKRQHSSDGGGSAKGVKRSFKKVPSCVSVPSTLLKPSDRRRRKTSPAWYRPVMTLPPVFKSSRRRWTQ